MGNPALRNLLEIREGSRVRGSSGTSGIKHATFIGDCCATLQRSEKPGKN